MTESLRRKNSEESKNLKEIKNSRDFRRKRKSRGKKKFYSRRHFKRVSQSTTEKLGIKKDLRWRFRPLNWAKDDAVARKGLHKLIQVFQVRCAMCPR